MKVWQPGSHLSRGSAPDAIDDWSWRRTKHRLITLARLAVPYKRRVALAVLAVLAAAPPALAPPLLAKLAIDEGMNGNNGKGDLHALSLIVLAFVVTAILGFVTSALATYATGWSGERVLADLRQKLFTHLQRLSLGYYERNRAGVIVSRLTNDVDAIDQLVTDGFSILIQNTIVLTGAVVMLFVIDWKLALVTLIVLPPMAIGTAVFRVYSGRAYRAVRERLGLVTATLAEDIAGMRVVQTFTREEERSENFRQVNDQYRAANHQTVVTNAIYFPYVDVLSTTGGAIVLGYGGYLTFSGEVTIGTLVAFLGYLAFFFEPIQQLSQLYNTFISAIAALDKITTVLDEEPEIRDDPAARELTRIGGRVTFDRVRFGYGSGPEVLHGIDLEVAPGTSVALVGHTGAGKSTIAKLLARFYDPREGAVLIDGVDLRNVTQESLRRQLGIVPQEGFLFAGSARDNVAFSRPDATLEQVQAAARAVGAAEFIEGLADGYDTQIGERGWRLSNGQRQLIAFARALLADPRILVLDEATSSVDIATERAIEQGLGVLLAGRTAFVIAHRLSTIRGADLIVVLENGQVVEQGTHEELLARQGLYTSLYGDWAEVA